MGSNFSVTSPCSLCQYRLTGTKKAENGAVFCFRIHEDWGWV
jgi:hypothetical protein